jgi:hypothetical protein
MQLTCVTCTFNVSCVQSNSVWNPVIQLTTKYKPHSKIFCFMRKTSDSHAVGELRRSGCKQLTRAEADKNWAGGNNGTSRNGPLKAGVIGNSARCLLLLLLILQLIHNEEIQIIPHCYSWPASKSFFQRNWQHRSLHNNRITRETMNEFKFTKANILFT